MLCLSHNSIVHTLNCLNTNQAEWNLDEQELIEEYDLKEKDSMNKQKLSYEEEKIKAKEYFYSRRNKL